MINYDNPPEKVEVYISKNKVIIQALWSIIGLLGSLYLFVQYEVKLLLIPIVVSLIALFFDLKKYFRKVSVITISKDGILAKEEFISWNHIKKYKIVEHNIRQKTYTLNIDTFQKSIIVNIDDLTFIPEDIRSLIILYKGMCKK